MRGLHDAGALSLLLALAACGPDEMTEGDDSESRVEDPVAAIADCGVDRPCEGLAVSETTMCALARIQSGEPAYVTFPYGYPCLEGPTGTSHLLIRDAATLTMIDEIVEFSPETRVYDVAVDLELVAENIATCEQAIADGFECEPCHFVMGLGERTSHQRFSCDE